jgi:hypothetical protein
VFVHRKFDIEIGQEVRVSELGWPGRGEAACDASLGGNPEYTDLRGLSWKDAKRIFEIESEMIRRIENASDPEAESDAIDADLFQCGENLYGLDIGVASTVVCLSAAGCVPFSSCNGGALGGEHHEDHPLIAAFVRKKPAKGLIALAAQTGIGLKNGPSGCLILYASHIRDFRTFAEKLLQQGHLEATRP